MKKSSKPKHFLNKTSYPGGNKALNEFIRQHLIYPEEALKNRIEGTVAVLFDIDNKGVVSNAKIKAGLGSGCDEEAVRIVSLLKYASTKNRGMYVVFHQTLNIHFKLHDAVKPIEQQVTIKYTIKKDDKPTPTVVTYNIKLN